MRYLKLFSCLLILTPVLTNCKTAKSNQETGSRAPSITPVGENLAPGTISASIIVNAVLDNELVTATIQEVLGYGSATDPVSVNTQVQFRIPDSMTIDKKALIKKEAILKVELRQAQTRMTGDSTSPKLWKLISIK